jgi:hypothetical protein
MSDQDIAIPFNMTLSKWTQLIVWTSIGFMFAFFMLVNTYIIEPLQNDNTLLIRSAVIQHQDIEDLQMQNIGLQGQVDELKKPTSFGVRMTNYYPVESQCDADPLITASGAKINIDDASNHRWIAISWDLHKNLSYRLPKDDPAYGKGTFEMGDYVRLTGYGPSVDGIYQIQDTMNIRHRMAIDRLTNVDSPLEFAENVTITKVFIPELHSVDV